MTLAIITEINTFEIKHMGRHNFQRYLGFGNTHYKGDYKVSKSLNVFIGFVLSVYFKEYETPHKDTL